MDGSGIGAPTLLRRFPRVRHQSTQSAYMNYTTFLNEESMGCDNGKPYTQHNNRQKPTATNIIVSILDVDRIVQNHQKSTARTQHPHPATNRTNVMPRKKQKKPA